MGIKFYVLCCLGRCEVTPLHIVVTTPFAVHYQKIYFHLCQSYINNVNKFSLTPEYISLMLIELSIRIFEYVSIFNKVNWQTNARSDILSFIVIYIKIYFNNTKQKTIAFIDKHS